MTLEIPAATIVRQVILRSHYFVVLMVELTDGKFADVARAYSDETEAHHLCALQVVGNTMQEATARWHEASVRRIQRWV